LGTSGRGNYWVMTLIDDDSKTLVSIFPNYPFPNPDKPTL